MEDLGKSHKIHVVVNNRQEEHELTVFENLGIIVHQNLSILIDPCATKIFISGAVLKIIKVKAGEHGEFIYVEMDLRVKQKVRGKVIGCSINLGEFFPREKLYVMILGYYVVVFSMDRLESHEVVINCKTKWLSLVDDEGKRPMIVG